MKSDFKSKRGTLVYTLINKKTGEEVFKGNSGQAARFIQTHSNTISSQQIIESAIVHIRDCVNKSCEGFRVRSNEFKNLK